MAHSIAVSPPNALLLISDQGGGVAPASMRGSAFASTDACIAVGCKADLDGPTEIILGAFGEVDPGRSPDFSARLSTPTGRIAVRTVTGSDLMAMSIAGPEALVRIWTNDSLEPDEVIIGVDAAPRVAP
jgi:hypothetical protein